MLHLGAWRENYKKPKAGLYRKLFESCKVNDVAFAGCRHSRQVVRREWRRGRKQAQQGETSFRNFTGEPKSASSLGSLLS